MKRLLLVLQILSKYNANGKVMPAWGLDSILIAGPTLDDIFDPEDVKILKDNGCEWNKTSGCWFWE